MSRKPHDMNHKSDGADENMLKSRLLITASASFGGGTEFGLAQRTKNRARKAVLAK
jgi:hypothetical protein